MVYTWGHWFILAENPALNILQNLVVIASFQSFREDRGKFEAVTSPKSRSRYPAREVLPLKQLILCQTLPHALPDKGKGVVLPPPRSRLE